MYEDLRNRVSDREAREWWLDRLPPRAAFALGFALVALVVALALLIA